jgi:aspartate 4-decarboxylase
LLGGIHLDDRNASADAASKLSIGRWFKRAGDPVSRDEPLVEINTDSDTLDSPDTGHRRSVVDRLVADSRAVALNHTAGLSMPQQLQMALFALSGLMDREHRYKDAAKQLIRRRYQTLYKHMGIEALHQLNDVNYYSLIDLQEIGGTLYGPEFKAWFIKSDLGINFLFRLADETGVVLLPGNGFEVVDTSARVSLANLTEIEYASIGKFTRQVLDECQADFKKTVVLQ